LPHLLLRRVETLETASGGEAVSCQEIKLPDGTVVLAMVAPGAKLTDEDKAALAEYIQFCRDRKAAKAAKQDAAARQAKQRFGRNR